MQDGPDYDTLNESLGEGNTQVNQPQTEERKVFKLNNREMLNKIAKNATSRERRLQRFAVDKSSTASPTLEEESKGEATDISSRRNLDEANNPIRSAQYKMLPDSTPTERREAYKLPNKAEVF